MLNLKQNRINKIKLAVKDAADNKYPTALNITAPDKDMVPMNNRCQYNAVNAVKTGRAVAVIECVMISEDSCTAHYINLLEDGSIVDLTLGWAWSGGDYRLVRYVHESEYECMGEKLGDLKERLCDGFC
jgi:hypothetical protein